MDMIMLAIAMAITVEGIVEYVKTVIKTAENKEYKTLVTQAIALASGVMLCMTTGADIYAAMGVVFTQPVIGLVLTGIFVSRGANYVSDFVAKLHGVKNPQYIGQ